MSDKKEVKKLSYGAIGFLYSIINLIPLKSVEVSRNLLEIDKAIKEPREYYLAQVKEIGTNKLLLDELNKKTTEVDLTVENKKMLREQLENTYKREDLSVRGMEAANCMIEIGDFIKE